MKYITSNELKVISRNILADFDRVCRNNNIKYTIAYGTLLGAVRHHGFIPWDDDVVVIMLRDEYAKFLKCIGQLNEKYTFVSVETNDKYTTPLPKIYDNRTELIELHHRDKFKLGVYIDILIFDYLPQNYFLKSICQFRSMLARKIWGLATYETKTNFFLEKVLRNIAFKINLGRKASLMINWLNSNNNKSQLVANLQYSIYGLRKDTFTTADLLNVTNIKFENIEVLAVKNYDLFLKQWYNDYMCLPPIEKRVTHHNFITYYL